jgi:tetratricopeptide (TPR) repeat protein
MPDLLHIALPSRGRSRTVAWSLAILASWGCAASTGASFVPAPEEMPALEAAVAEDPDDLEAAIRLGAGYRAAGDLDSAVRVLEGAYELDPEDPNAVLFLGLAYEDQRRVSDALALYEAYMEVGRSGEVKDQLEGRIQVLRRQELQMAVEAALARESELAGTSPEPSRVAVFPFVYGGTDDALQPLSRAMAEMLSTDLAQSDRLEVLERVQVQALLDEMALAESGFVEEETAARSGYLLGAGRVIQGRIDGNTSALSLEAAVVGVEASGSEQLTTVSRSDEASRLFDMEKELAFDIFESLGIALTTSERERVNQRPTENLQALLAYGEGLLELDRGNYAAARASFEAAAQLDPGFRQAQDASTTAGQAESAETTSTSDVADASMESNADLAPTETVESLVQQAVQRDPVQEVTGTEGAARPLTVIEIILRARGGGE